MTEKYIDEIRDYIAKWEKTCASNPERVTEETIKNNTSRKRLLDEHVTQIKTLNKQLRILVKDS